MATRTAKHPNSIQRHKSALFELRALQLRHNPPLNFDFVCALKRCDFLYESISAATVDADQEMQWVVVSSAFSLSELLLDIKVKKPLTEKASIGMEGCFGIWNGMGELQVGSMVFGMFDIYLRKTFIF